MPKKITIEKLAKIVEKGFKFQGGQIGELKEAIKVQGEDLRKTIKESIEELAGMTAGGFNEVHERFDRVEDRLERIEKLTLEDHRKRIIKLEAEVKYLKEIFAIK